MIRLSNVPRKYEVGRLKCVVRCPVLREDRQMRRVVWFVGGEGVGRCIYEQRDSSTWNRVQQQTDHPSTCCILCKRRTADSVRVVLDIS
jgi:hypothetical protein